MACNYDDVLRNYDEENYFTFERGQLRWVPTFWPDTTQTSRQLWPYEPGHLDTRCLPDETIKDLIDYQAYQAMNTFMTGYEAERSLGCSKSLDANEKLKSRLDYCKWELPARKKLKSKVPTTWDIPWNDELLSDAECTRAEWSYRQKTITDYFGNTSTVKKRTASEASTIILADNGSSQEPRPMQRTPGGTYYYVFLQHDPLWIQAQEIPLLIPCSELDGGPSAKRSKPCVTSTPLPLVSTPPPIRISPPDGIPDPLSICLALPPEEPDEMDDGFIENVDEIGPVTPPLEFRDVVMEIPRQYFVLSTLKDLACYERLTTDRERSPLPRDNLPQLLGESILGASSSQAIVIEDSDKEGEGEQEEEEDEGVSIFDEWAEDWQPAVRLRRWIKRREELTREAARLGTRYRLGRLETSILGDNETRQAARRKRLEELKRGIEALDLEIDYLQERIARRC